MASMIFVNLPVSDLPRSKAFFGALGYRFDPKFTNDDAACMVIEEGSIYAMLLTHAHFRQFTPRPIADARQVTEVLTCLSAPSRDGVDALVGKALAAGGTQTRDPMDYGFMYARSFADPDGHIWEIAWMDPKQVAEGCPQATASA